MGKYLFDIIMLKIKFVFLFHFWFQFVLYLQVLLAARYLGQWFDSVFITDFHKAKTMIPFQLKQNKVVINNLY